MAAAASDAFCATTFVGVYICMWACPLIFWWAFRSVYMAGFGAFDDAPENLELEGCFFCRWKGA